MGGASNAQKVFVETVYQFCKAPNQRATGQGLFTWQIEQDHVTDGLLARAAEILIHRSVVSLLTPAERSSLLTWHHLLLRRDSLWDHRSLGEEDQTKCGKTEIEKFQLELTLLYASCSIT